MTATEFAEKINTPYPTVMAWLREGRIRGAQLQEVGNMKFWLIPTDVLKDFVRPKKGRPTFRVRLKAIAAEVRKELSDQYADFDLLPEAQDSVDGRLTYKAHSGEQVLVLVVRRASQTDDEIRDEIRAQLLPKTDGPRRAAKKAAKKSKRGARAK